MDSTATLREQVTCGVLCQGLQSQSCNSYSASHTRARILYTKSESATKISEETRSALGSSMQRPPLVALSLPPRLADLIEFWLVGAGVGPLNMNQLLMVLVAQTPLLYSRNSPRLFPRTLRFHEARAGRQPRILGET